MFDFSSLEIEGDTMLYMMCPCILHLLIRFLKLLPSMRNLYIMHHAGNKTPQHI